MPTANSRKFPSIDETAPPPPGAFRASAPPACRSSTLSNGECVDRRIVQVGEHHAVAGTGHRPLGIHVQTLQLLRGDRREGVHSRTELTQRPQQLVGAVLPEQRRRLDDDERLAPHRLGDVRNRRELQEAANRRHLIRDGVDPAPPRAQHLGAPLQREEEDARVDLADRVERELERRDDAERAAAAAQSPEEVGVLLRIGANEPAARVHELDGRNAVRGEAVAPGQPADAAAEGVAHDADIGRRARERGETVLRGRVGDVAPQHARLDARPLRDGVDLDPAHSLGLEQHRMGERAERMRVVARALRRNAQAALTRPAHDSLDVFGRLGQCNRGGLLVDGEVPGEPRLVPIRVVR
jgi:hypothetical protein